MTKLRGFLLSVGVIVALGAAYASDTKPVAPAAVPAAPPAASAQPSVTKAQEQLAEKKEQSSIVNSPLLNDAPLPGDHVKGNPKAKVKLIEYASMSCPHCAYFHNKVLPELEKKYIDTGKVALIFRPFPLNDPALKASILMECAAAKKPESYFTFARVLFDAQSKWAYDGAFTSALETFANVGGIGKDEFAACLADSKREMAVLEVKKAANDQLGVPHTPYFFINNQRFEGDRTPEGFGAVFDALLAEKK